MIRIKTLSLPLIPALVAVATPAAHADVVFSLSTQKTYRQTKSNINFKGGRFDAAMRDGNFSFLGGCSRTFYYRPGYYINICPIGSTGFLSAGRVNGVDITTPYMAVTSVAPSLVIAGKAASQIRLIAAPASSLPRPSGGFYEDSVSLYYNLHTTNIREYNVTEYFQRKNYTQAQRGRFEKDIVTGVYRYAFPRLNSPTIPAVVTATVFPMAEGFAKVNNKSSGFKFESVGDNVWSGGFVQLSYLRPNTFRWSGITRTNAFAATDTLNFSLRRLINPRNPKNSEVIRATSIFPAFDNGGNNSAKVQLATPYTTSYVTPPIFAIGTRGVAELELERSFQTGGITYDFSIRRFQIPIEVVDNYQDFALLNLSEVSTKKRDILADADGDGYNNLTEWILETGATDPGDMPVGPIPAEYQAYYEDLQIPDPLNSYFGFNVDVKVGTNPAVNTILQRSTDQGRTWQTFQTSGGANTGWSVDRVTGQRNGVPVTQIQVRSKQPSLDPNATIPFVQPNGTAGDLYRVKITLVKNAKIKAAAKKLKVVAKKIKK
ncbi:MAG: hypothetical protein EOP85_05300 [Verrucomicrobiaceae bacterium]|nr:MAG: hypothetical protein EOP85_05300 [Verrucomicrobiaceae bacterium]